MSPERSAVATVTGDHAISGLPDRQGWSTLLAGGLLLLISFTANDGDDDLADFRSLQAAHQIGVGLHLASLAAIVGDVELASRLQHRAVNDVAEERERTARRARIQAGFLAGQCRFLLADTARNRLHLPPAAREELNQSLSAQQTGHQRCRNRPAWMLQIKNRFCGHHPTAIAPLQH